MQLVNSTYAILEELCLLPKDINILTIEYLFFVSSEEHVTMLRLYCNISYYSVIKNNNVYTYNRVTHNLKIEPINKDFIVHSRYTEIFIHTDDNIYVYDCPVFVFVYNGCTLIKTIGLQYNGSTFLENICVSDNKVYLRDYKSIYIFAMNGTLINKIIPDNKVWQMQVHNNMLYVKCDDGIRELNTKTKIHSGYPDDFQLTEYEIYAVYEDKLCVYDYDDNIIRSHTIPSYTDIYIDKNMIYYYVYKQKIINVCHIKELDIRHFLKH